MRLAYVRLLALTALLALVALAGFPRGVHAQAEGVIVRPVLTSPADDAERYRLGQLFARYLTTRWEAIGVPVLDETPTVDWAWEISVDVDPGPTTHSVMFAVAGVQRIEDCHIRGKPLLAHYQGSDLGEVARLFAESHLPILFPDSISRH